MQFEVSEAPLSFGIADDFYSPWLVFKVRFNTFRTAGTIRFLTHLVNPRAIQVSLTNNLGEGRSFLVFYSPLSLLSCILLYVNVDGTPGLPL